MSLSGFGMEFVMNYVIENDVLRVEVSRMGGELQSIVKDGGEYLWQGDPEYWDQKAPNLFPYIARLTEGKYTLNGKEYYLPIHGFIASTELVREEQSKERIVFRLDADEKTGECYPYDFTYRIIYELDEDMLNITYQVENHGEETMYFGIGGHPGFAVPVEGSSLWIWVRRFLRTIIWNFQRFWDRLEKQRKQMTGTKM